MNLWNFHHIVRQHQQLISVLIFIYFPLFLFVPRPPGSSQSPNFFISVFFLFFPLNVFSISGSSTYYLLSMEEWWVKRTELTSLRAGPNLFPFASFRPGGRFLIRSAAAVRVCFVYTVIDFGHNNPNNNAKKNKVISIKITVFFVVRDIKKENQQKNQQHKCWL